jgi:hypothetical protein
MKQYEATILSLNITASTFENLRGDCGEKGSMAKEIGALTIID